MLTPNAKLAQRSRCVAQLCSNGSSSVCVWWWRGHIQSCVLCHHSLETDTNTLNDGEEDGASDSAVSYSFGASTDGKGTSGEETGDDGVPRIFLLATRTISRGGESGRRCYGAYRMPLTAQSNVENMPPQTPKLPPRTGARALMAVRAGKKCQK